MLGEKTDAVTRGERKCVSSATPRAGGGERMPDRGELGTEAECELVQKSMPESPGLGQRVSDGGGERVSEVVRGAQRLRPEI